MENKKLSNKLSRVQHYVCKIIQTDLDANEAEGELGFSLLESRKLAISEKSARQMISDPQFSPLFKRNEREASRSYGKIVEPRWNRKRYGLSFIPFFSKIISKQDQ